jgi:hypothetical protein
MSEPAPQTSPVVAVAGLLTILGGVVVLASIFVPTLTVAETTVDLYLWGGIVFAIGFAGGAKLHLERGDRGRAAAQVTGALGWLFVVIGGTVGPSWLFLVGLAGLVIGALLLYEIPGKVADRLG